MSQSLRPYQETAIGLIRSSWESGHRAPVLVAPTGSGKTIILAHLLMRMRPDVRVLVLAPWRQLVRQAHARLCQHGIVAGVLMGRQSPQPTDTVHVASIQTAARRTLGTYDLIVVDEAHHAVSRQCLALLRRYPRARLLGLTAIPIRLDSKPLSKAFDDLLEPVTVSELMRLGFLVRPIVYAREVPLDLSNVAVDRTGDYATRSLAHAVNRAALVGDAIKHWRRHARGRPTFVYCVSRAHAEAVTERFRRANIPAACIDGRTSTKRRAVLLGDLEAGRLKVLTNVGVLTEGVDLPVLGCLVLLRPTLSLGLHLQIVGRGLRPAAGKTSVVILDHADNFRRHGFPEDTRHWSLYRAAKASGRHHNKPSRICAKQCPECGVLVPAVTVTCHQCGFVWMPRELEGTLRRLFPRSIRETEAIIRR